VFHCIIFIVIIVIVVTIVVIVIVNTGARLIHFHGIILGVYIDIVGAHRLHIITLNVCFIGQRIQLGGRALHDSNVIGLSPVGQRAVLTQPGCAMDPDTLTEGYQ
jgi:hypothetical protein